jgi:hypothetical protein
MSRRRIQIEIHELQDAIDQLEANRLFSSPSKLYEAIAETPWAQALGATPILFYNRVKEVNIDPDNPVITMRVKPARRMSPRAPGEPGATRRRARIQIDVGELQYEIDQLEAQQTFTSPSKLYEALTQTLWGQALDVSPTMFYMKVKEVNTDPENPVITMKVQPARKKGEGKRRVKVADVSFGGLDILIETFTHRGIEVTGVESLISSSHKSPDENRAIRLAWADLRDILGLPKPVKKSVPAVDDDGIPVTPIPTVEELLAEEPTAAEWLAMGMTVEAPTTVIEETPDGQPVSSQTVVQRPTPVRSSLPPRPMPIAAKQ